MIAAYLGVEDEEVEKVEAEVGYEGACALRAALSVAGINVLVEETRARDAAAAAHRPRRKDLLRQHHRPQGRRPRRARGRDRHAHRRERGRQIDTDDDDLRQPPGARGPIAFDGRDITHLPTHEIAQLQIAQSPEGRRIFPRMTVYENLQMGASVNGFAHFEDDLDGSAPSFRA